MLLILAISLGFAFSSTPTYYKFSYSAGYDNNVLRFSKSEIKESNSNPSILGGANSFDSFLNKFSLATDKTIFIKKNHQVKYNIGISKTLYSNNINKDYWSGNVQLKYRWGSYKNIKYSFRHLNRFYLRHYIDRDISNDSYKPCFFSDQKQMLSFSQKVNKSTWVNLSYISLNRYYDRPFTEFDLDILSYRLKINRKFSSKILLSFQIENGQANNISYLKTAVSSDFDRSYKTKEFYVPLIMNDIISYISTLGMSYRIEDRKYIAENTYDPLHAGRSHQDRKIDMWFEKNINDEIKFIFQIRNRLRDTSSSYKWVDNLKSFRQTQISCKIQWGYIYDKY